MLSPRDSSSQQALGAAPGEVTEEHLEEQEEPKVSVFSYGPESFEELEDASVEQALAARDAPGVTWINVDGLGDLDVLETLWKELEIHPLVQEDAVHLDQRPKFEEYEGQNFLLVRMAQLVKGKLVIEQVSIVFGPDWIVSFQETHGDVFDQVRERIRKGRPRLCTAGPDYLAYSLLDAVVDGFFPVLEVYGEQIDEAETTALEEPSEETIHQIHNLRGDLLEIRHALWPLRDAINAMQRAEDAPLIAEETRTFLRDVYDHVVLVMEMVETYREVTGSLADLYYSTMSYRMNEVMKVLTIVATIFIPLTFIAGIYGMNFDPEASPWNMPELNWTYGYPASLGLMLLIALGMLAYFRRRGWW